MKGQTSPSAPVTVVVFSAEDLKVADPPFVSPFELLRHTWESGPSESRTHISYSGRVLARIAMPLIYRVSLEKLLFLLKARH